MRRIVVAAALAGGGVVAVRALAPRVHGRMLAACERMFADMPEGFPPKRMLHGIEETRANTARIIEILEGREQGQGGSVALDDTQLARTEELVVA